MSERLVDRDGRVYERSMLGGWEPATNAIGMPIHHTDWNGSPKIKRDLLGRPAEARDLLGRNVVGSGGEELYLPG